MLTFGVDSSQQGHATTGGFEESVQGLREQTKSSTAGFGLYSSFSKGNGEGI